MQTKALPYQLIENSFKDGLEDTLSYFIRLKSKYKKPIFYNYSLSKISKILNCSRSTAKKHIGIMIEKGWATEHALHLCLTSSNKINHQLNSFFIKVPVTKKKSDQVYFLRYALLKRRLNFQIKEVKKKTEIVKIAKQVHGKITKKMMKKLLSHGGVYKFEKSIKSRITLSNKKIGAYFERSKSTGARYQKRMNQMGLIRSTAHYDQKSADFFRDHEILRKMRNISMVNGFLFIRSSNNITQMQ